MFVVLSASVSLFAAPSLPEQMTAHWNAAGQPDGTMSKTISLAFVPVISAVLLGLFALLPRIDPLRDNIAEFRPYYDWLVVVFTGYLLVVHAGIIAFNLGYEFDFTAFVLVGAAGLFYYIGVLLTHAERNWFVGIRTPWTLESDEVWNRTHELGGRLFKLTAVLALVGLAFGEYAIYFLVVPALLTAGVTTVYSFVLYRRLGRTETNTHM
jgi:uncharacterized membrane protein